MRPHAAAQSTQPGSLVRLVRRASSLTPDLLSAPQEAASLLSEGYSAQPSPVRVPADPSLR